MSAAGSRGPHLLFGGVVGLLALLLAWWFWFLAHAVKTEDVLWRRAMALEASLAQRELEDDPLALGRHPGLEATTEASGRVVVSMSSQAEGAHSDAMRRRRIMVYGEGSLLVVLVLGCVAMLYRLVLAERGYRRDAEQFLSRATHEMKTPLAGLRALLQTLRDGHVPPERLREVAELGLRQAEREEHLIENMLTAHRIATQGHPLDLCELDLAVLLADLVVHRRRTMGAEADGLALACPDGLRATANADALQTILENLADNAYKYGASRLEVAASSDDDGVLIRVTDDGEGFEPAQAASLFTPFRRGSGGPRSGRHGTGLGLPIAAALADEMGGSLSGTSDGPGRGATFVLRLRAPASRAAGA